MAITEVSAGTDVIDLRAGSARPDADAGPSEPDPSGTPGSAAEDGRPLRRIVVLVLLALAAVVVADMVLGAAVHAEHQRHLAAEIQDPQADLGVGDASYVLQIPSIGLNEVVVEGSSATELRGGPGRRLDTGPVGEDGNTVIQGTSTRFGGPFSALDELVAGKTIYLRSRTGEVSRFRVTKVQEVGDGAIRFLEAGGPRRLTLVTSAAGPLSGQRLVVTALPDADYAEVQAAAETSEGDGAEGDAVDGDASSESEPAADDGEAARVAAEDGPQRAYDVRGLGTWLLLGAGLGLVVIGLLGWSGLRSRYRVGTVAVVAGSSISLGLVLVLFNISAFLPTTF
jgi:LPXTG-site transpeptidase (sortase) family protein